jgi:predicted acetyltransferase
MDVLEFRQLREEEFAEAVRLDEIAFAEEHGREDVPYLKDAFDFDRSFCAFDRGRLVGISSALPLEMTLPGGVLVPVAGVTWIAVSPTHRRRGILTRLMRHQLEQAQARREVAAALIAAEGGIYGRFGLGPATSIHSIRVARERSAFLSPRNSRGRLTLLDGDEAAAKLPPLFETLRRRQPGEVSRSRAWWSDFLHDSAATRGGASAMLCLLHESHAGVPDGYAIYRVKEEWQSWNPANEVQLLELMAADEDVYADLWRFLLDLDLTRGVRYERGRMDEPLRWLLADPRALQVEALIDYLWVRVLDIPRALASRRYATGGRLVLEVSEDFPRPGSTRVLLRVDADGTARCQASEGPCDISLHLSALGAAYLGGVSFAELCAAGRARECTPEAIACADSMFSVKPAPHCGTMF